MTCTVQEEGGLEETHVMCTSICTIILPSFLHVILRLVMTVYLAQVKRASSLCFGGNPPILATFQVPKMEGLTYVSSM